MNSDKLLRQAFGLLMVVLLLAGCGGEPAKPATTSPSLPSVSTFTPVSPTTTPGPTFTSVPPTATATIVPTPAAEATVPVDLKQPVVLLNNQIKFTITEVKSLGDRVGGFSWLYIKSEYRDTHHLLVVTAPTENPTNQERFLLGMLDLEKCRSTASSSNLVCLIMQDEKGQEIKPAGLASTGIPPYASPPTDAYWLDSSNSVGLIKAGEKQLLYFAFAVPKELKRFTLHLIVGPSP